MPYVRNLVSSVKVIENLRGNVGQTGSVEINNRVYHCDVRSEASLDNENLKNISLKTVTSSTEAHT